MKIEKRKYRMVKLKEAIVIDKKSIYPNKIEDEDIFIGLEDISKETGLINTSKRAKECDVKSNKYKFTSEHILYGKLRPNLNKVAVPNIDGICSTDIYPIMVQEEKAYKNYIFHIMHSKTFVKYASNRTNGINLPRVNEKILNDYEIPLPPIGIQRKIAKTLDTVAELLAMRKQQLAELDNLIKSIFYDMFGDPVANKKAWKLKPIGNFSKVKIGPFGTLLHAEDYIENGFPLINPSHIIDGKIVPNMKLTLNPEKFKELQHYAMKTGDIVIGRRGEIGRCAIVDDEGYLCGTGSMFIRVEKDYLPITLQHIISSDTIRAKLEHQAVGVTMKNLNAGTISNLQVPLIPLNLQTQFAEIVTKIEEQKALVQKAIDETQYLFDSLMSEYFDD